MPSKDETFMLRALELARSRGDGAHPNPRVGACLVKSGRVVGEGAHERFGGPHAEVMALRKAGSRARGASLYVTLEPCSHHGKTPPCTEALIRAGVREVVAAVQDPNPLVRGRGFRLLKAAGLKVRCGPLRHEAEELNEAHWFGHAFGRPLVTLKAAATLDGRIAASTGRSKWITGEEARKEAHRLRALTDAVLVGAGTARADDPALTVRLPGFKRRDGFPIRVVLDGRLTLKPGARVLKGPQRTIVFTGLQASAVRERSLRQAGAWVQRIPARNGMLSLKAVLKSLFRIGVRSLLVEGGSRVHGAFLNERLADKVCLFLAPKLLGGEGALAWFTGVSWDDPNRCPRLRDARMRRLGEDFLVTGRMDYGEKRKAVIRY